MKFWPNPYRDTPDRSTLWILLGVLVFALIIGTAALWMLHSTLR